MVGFQVVSCARAAENYRANGHAACSWVVTAFNFLLQNFKKINRLINNFNRFLIKFNIQKCKHIAIFPSLYIIDRENRAKLSLLDKPLK